MKKSEYNTIKSNILIECGLKFGDKPTKDTEETVRGVLEIVMKNLNDHIEEEKSDKCWGC